MSTRDTSLDAKILKSAKKEFLEKGFLEASLKAICDDAGVTTGAIYRRYQGKEALLIDVVKPAVELFKTIQLAGLELNQQRATENRLNDSWVEFNKVINYWLDKIYHEQETVKILLARSEGTIYSNFMHDFIEENFSISYDFMKELASQNKCHLKLTYQEYHIFVTSYWTTIFEMIVHDFTREEARKFVPKINQFFAWHKFIIFNDH